MAIDRLRDATRRCISRAGNVGGGCYAQIVSETSTDFPAGNPAALPGVRSEPGGAQWSNLALGAGSVGGACYAPIVSETSDDLDSRIEEIASAVALLGWRLPRVRAPAAARRIAHGLHLALVDVASGRGALEIAIGEGLAEL